MKFADIAVNLTDPQFEGTYHGRQKHSSDLEAVVSRAKGKGVERILITGTSLEESRRALELARCFGLHSTAGCHPTSASEIESYPGGAERYLADLRTLIAEDRGEGGSKRVISVGEIGLDYDRLHHSPRETQLKHLPALLALAREFQLPMFLHSRTSESHVDLVAALRAAGWGDRGEGWKGGVVHSFTGTKAEVQELVGMGLHVGVNGCSLKTEENLEVVKTIPLDRLLLETDSPWCSCTSTQASHAHLPPPESPLHIPKVSKPQGWKPDHGVKGRMEPAEIGLVAHVVARTRGMAVEELAAAVWTNTMRLFYPEDKE
ncbi:Deoxyribonuclease Tat-D [Saitozyma sp. JCM 24511]|nr:Deoxyribonuclease Tat-D [Saitozyma sp. JCM 24511]